MSLNLKNDDYRIENGVLTWVREDIIDLEIPDGVVSTNVNFTNLHNLQYLRFPDTITEFPNLSRMLSLKKVVFSDNLIEICIMSECKKLKYVKLPRQLYEIPKNAFLNCTSLEKITIPEGLSDICKYAFYGCSSLKKIVLPESLELVDDYAFGDCSSLEEIIIPNTNKHYITIKRAFDGCTNLKSLRLPEALDYAIYGGYSGIEEYYTFGSCPSVEELFVPLKLAYKCPNEIYLNCESLKYIFIECTKAKSLKESINQNKMKREIIKNLKELMKKNNVYYKVKFVFAKEKNKTEQKEADIIEVDDLEIKRLIEQIKEICNNISEENRQLIYDRINEIIEEYIENKDSLKPKYNSDDMELKLDNNMSMVRTKTIIALEGIILGLSREKELIKFLSDIEKYKQIIAEDVTELSNDNSLESNIKNIIYYSNLVDVNKRNNLISELKLHLEKASKEASKQLSSLSSDTALTLNNPDDYITKLNLEISKTLDNIKIYYEKVKPFLDLLNALNSSDVNIEKNKGTITEDISTIRYILSKLSNGKYKEELKNSINNLFGKYKERLAKIISDDELLKKEDYDKLELEFRNDLSPILESINNYAYLDKYEENTANKVNIYNQIKKTIEMISNGKKIKLNEEISSEVITSFVIEIFNYTIECCDKQSGLLEVDDKKQIIRDLLEILNKELDSLDNNTIDSLEEYNEIIRNILKKLAKVKYDVEKLVKERREYYNINSEEHNKKVL